LGSLGQNFGLQPLVGKPLAIVGDVRLGKDSTSSVVERLLSISGEDGLTCDRKFKEPWTGKLPTRFLLISNELPKFGDASGAIATRFIVLELVQSFLGREIATLTEDLMKELPGILLWALDGLDEISRHPFTRVASSEDSIRQMQDLVSPISAFVRDMCERAPDYDDEVAAVYRAWKDWCEVNGHRLTSSPVFGRDLRSVMPGLRTFKPHGQPRRYAGIRLQKTNSYTARNGKTPGSRGSPGSGDPGNGQSEPHEPGEPHVLPLRAVRSDEDLPFIERCTDCGERLDEPGFRARCRPSHKINN
jgi:putative DNA primase/helicase